MKIITARLGHESHAFSVVPTTLASFAATELLFGDDVVRHMTGTRTETGGIIASAKRFGWELVPTVAALAMPSGPVTRATYEALLEPILFALQAHRDAAAVVLALHGAMSVDGLPDAEGDLLRRIREIIGTGRPLAASLDLHANVTDEMVRHASILTSFRTTPHVDQYETGVRLCALVERTLCGEIAPRVYVGRRPMLAGMDLGRTVGDTLMTGLQRKARAWEARSPAILDVSLNAGYYFGDVYEAGPSVVVIGNGEDALCRQVADELIDDAWSWRDQKTVHLQGIDSAIERALAPADGAGPLILADYTDGPGGGGYGDATHLLRALVAAQVPGSVVGELYDPESVRQAGAAGVGATRSFRIGGKTDARYGGGPLEVEARVLALSDGNYVRTGPYMTGTDASIGPSAALEIGAVRVIVCSHRVQAEERSQYRILGIDPERVNVLALKGINHFRADFEPIARGIVFVEAGGIHASDLRTLPFRNVRRPIWPLDDAAAVELRHDQGAQQ